MFDNATFGLFTSNNPKVGLLKVNGPKVGLFIRSILIWKCKVNYFEEGKYLLRIFCLMWLNQ